MPALLTDHPGRSCFSDRSKITNLVEDVEILLPVKFRWIPFSGCREEVENVSANHRQGQPSFFPIDPKNKNLVEDIEILLPVKFRKIPFSSFRGEVENVSDNQRPGQSSCFPIGPDNTNLVVDVEILLPIKFRWIPFSDGRTTGSTWAFGLGALTTTSMFLFTNGHNVTSLINLMCWVSILVSCL